LNITEIKLPYFDMGYYKFKYAMEVYIHINVQFKHVFLSQRNNYWATFFSYPWLILEVHLKIVHIYTYIYNM